MVSLREGQPSLLLLIQFVSSPAGPQLKPFCVTLSNSSITLEVKAQVLTVMLLPDLVLHDLSHPLSCYSPLSLCTPAPQPSLLSLKHIRQLPPSDLGTGSTLACSVFLQTAMWLSLLKHHCLSQGFSLTLCQKF